MRKILAITCIVILFLIIYLIQSNFFTWFNIFGISPNLFIIFSIFIGLFLGKEYGFSFGLIFGLLLDLFLSGIIGINAISLGTAGLLAGILEKNFSREYKFTFLFITTILTFWCEFIKYLLILSIQHGEIQVLAFLKILLIETLYNILITIIVYPFLEKTGGKLRDILIDNKKQIKYF